MVCLPKRLSPLRALAVALLLGLAAGGAHAQQYPDRPVRLIVPFTPGSFIDVLARVVGRELAATWGQPVVVDNRVGAGGLIGTEAVAKAAPDGYTLGMGSNATFVTNYYVYAKVPYGLDALEPVLAVASISSVLLTNTTVPVATLAELIAYSKARPGRLNYSSAGFGFSGHIGMVLFADEAGLDLVHVPFRGGPLAAQALVAGEVNLVMASRQDALRALKFPGVKALAVASASRTPQFPEVPTFAETGYKNVVSRAWTGLMVPAGTRREVIEKIHRDATAAMRTREFTDSVATLDADAIGGTPKEFAQMIHAERERWGPVFKRHNIRAN